MVSRSEILGRVLRGLCPNCGEAHCFASAFRMHAECPVCGLKFERGDGFFLGSMAINYGVSIFLLVPIVLLWVAGTLSTFWAATLGILAAVVLPIVLFRFSRLLWLGIYFASLPQELPANCTTPESRAEFQEPEL